MPAAPHSFLSADSPDISLLALKLSESPGRGVIARFHETGGRPAEDVRFRPRWGGGLRLTRCSLFEDDVETLSQATLRLDPFGYATIRIEGEGALPAAPEVVVGQCTDKSVALRWPPVAGAREYHVYRGEDAAFTRMNTTAGHHGASGISGRLAEPRWSVSLSRAAVTADARQGVVSTAVRGRLGLPAVPRRPRSARCHGLISAPRAWRRRARRAVPAMGQSVNPTCRTTSLPSDAPLSNSERNLRGEGRSGPYVVVPFEDKGPAAHPILLLRPPVDRDGHKGQPSDVFVGVTRAVSGRRGPSAAGERVAANQRGSPATAVRFQRKGHRMNRLFVQRCVRISCRLLLLAMLSAASLAAEIHVSPSGCDDQRGRPRARPDAGESPRPGSIASAQAAHGGRQHLPAPGRHMIRKTVAFGRKIPGPRKLLEILARHDPAARPRPLWWAGGRHRLEKARGTTDRMSGRPIWALAITPFRQVYLNGKRLTWARYPNEDPARRIRAAGPTSTASARRCTKTSRRNAPTVVLRAEDARWSRPRMVKSASFPATTGGTASRRSRPTTPEPHDHARQEDGLRARPEDRFCIMGMREELDAPGEWFQDVEGRKLYLIPPAGAAWPAIS